MTSASGMALQLRERCGGLLVTGCVQSAAASPLEPAVRWSACPGGVGNSEDGRPKPKSEDAGGDSSSSFLRWLDRQGCGVENDLLQRISIHGPVQTVPLGQSQAHPPVRHSIPRRPDSSIGADGYRPNPCSDERTLVVPLSTSSLRRGNSLRHALPHPSHHGRRRCDALTLTACAEPHANRAFAPRRRPPTRAALSPRTPRLTSGASKMRFDTRV